MAIFDFTEFSSGDDFDDAELPYDEYLTVKAFLEMHCGKETGTKIYEGLRRMAEKAAQNTDGSFVPGLIFNDDGGEFVSFEEEHGPDFGLYNSEDN